MRRAMTAPASGGPLLEMRGITKSFFGVEVLKNVDLDLRRGEVHAVMGENGAGKSTLMKVLVGAHRPDSGTIVIDGEETVFHHTLDAQHRGISIMYQEFNLLPDRTVAQNIFLGREPAKRGIIDQGKLQRDTAALLERVGAPKAVTPNTLVGELSVAQQQNVEIAKALSLDAKVLVMDEPTAALAQTEVDQLLDQVRQLQEQGLGILYISHRLNEVFAVAQRITVLKDGEKVTTVPTEEVTSRQLVELMVGREMGTYYPERAKPEEIGDVRLSVRDGNGGMLHDISLEVRAGEILGIAGLQGSGRTEVARALFGAEPFDSGTVELDGEPLRVKTPRQGIAARLGFITEDRKAEGLVPIQNVKDNTLLTFRSLKLRDTPKPNVAELTKSVELRARSLETEVRFLSGGNQQKVVLAKWLATDPKVLIFDEPTRGIDVGAKAGIHDLMRDLAREGVAIIMISSELPEVIGMSDRIVVMHDGRIAGELPAEPSEADIMLMATGQGGADGPPIGAVAGQQ